MKEEFSQKNLFQGKLYTKITVGKNNQNGRRSKICRYRNVFETTWPVIEYQNGLFSNPIANENSAFENNRSF